MKVNFDEYKLKAPFSRKHWGIFNYMVTHSCAYPKSRKWQVGVGFLSFTRDEITTFYLAYKDLKGVQKFVDTICKDFSVLTGMEKYLARQKEEFSNEMCGKEPRSFSADKLKALFISSFSHLCRANEISVLLRGIDYWLLPELQGILLKKKIGEIDEALAILTSPSKSLFIFEEERDLLEAAQRYQQKKMNDESLEKIAKQLWQKYKLITMGNHREEPREKSYYREAIKNLADIAEDELEKLEEKIAWSQTSKSKLLEKLALSKRERKLFDIASEITYLKDEDKKTRNQIIYLTRSLYDEIVRRTKVSMEELKNFSPEEIAELIDGEIVDSKAVRERSRYSILIGIQGHFSVLLGEKAKGFEKKYLNVEAALILRGRIASKGKEMGPVKVVLSASEFYKVKKGDILVVGNTTPDYVVILKKVVAIVAEEGGVTAHVSVISREMHIPAVVGVNNATRLLKDGDLIEVDADNGIIRRL